MMDGIKRFITCHVPVHACNFQCMYCYISHLKIDNKKIFDFVMPAEDIANKLSKEVLGGTCYFNLCGNGETMLHPQLVDLAYGLTKEGHFADIITNGTISKKFDEIIARFSEEQKKHLFIKFSFHYLELKRKNLMETFLSNVKKIREAGISFTIEITPHDELIPYIEEIKAFSLKEFGALPHITVARNEATDDIELLTSLNRDKYKETWGQFNSALFDFKFSIFNKKREEFCYAGEWSLELDLKTGDYFQCYRGCKLGNIKDDKALKFRAIGKCCMPHCFNGHAFLAFGDIPKLESPTYCDERNRVTNNGSQWLNEDCRDFFSSKVYENNSQYTDEEKKKCISINNNARRIEKIKRIIRRVVGKDGE